MTSVTENNVSTIEFFGYFSYKVRDYVEIYARN